MGLRFLYSQSQGAEGLKTLEMTVFMRFFLLGFEVREGPFVQLSCGPVIFAEEGKSMSFPAEGGGFSVGLAAGWRFLFGDYFFLEPAFRAGYPYIAGAGVSAGIRF